MTTTFISQDDIRRQFSKAMSKMYQNEVPLYGELLDLVADVNKQVLENNPKIKAQLEATHELSRLNLERHGAIRLGTKDELTMMRRLFAVMGMFPVGYYDLAPAGVPVHSTAFRAIDPKALSQSPFRVFTSLLRLDLIPDEELKKNATTALSQRQIFTEKAVALIEQFENNGGLTDIEASEFIKEALETFRWHDNAPISKALYDKLADQHRLIADVVGFKGPHINHLTPRTLDIDAVQRGMVECGIPPKAIIEGPPRRNCPILLRQTSFKALEESVNFKAADGKLETGQHTARFGEIEQRGVALTPKGRALYDDLLNQARITLGGAPTEDNADEYEHLLQQSFAEFPDNYLSMHEQDLAYFYYQPNPKVGDFDKNLPLNVLIGQGVITIEPIVYEDFLPVSAAGIFQSNLHGDTAQKYATASNKQDFEMALGSTVFDELELYEKASQQSLAHCLEVLGIAAESQMQLV